MKSQTPTWAIVTGILMMLIGGCGLKNDIQSINIRELLSMKNEVMEKIVKSNEKKDKKSSLSETNESNDSLGNSLAMNDSNIVENDSLEISNHTENIIRDSTSEEIDPEFKEVEDIFNKFMDVPEETINLIIKFGYISLLFSFLLIIGGLFLLIKKGFSIQLAYAVLGANVVFSIVRWIMLSGKGGGLLAITNSLSAAFGILVCVILGIIIFSSDKSHYEDQYYEE